MPASVVVLLVALPLCLGIALGSNAPLFSGIIAGIVGGIIIGFLSGSQLSVSGPAAGLTVIVAAGISKLTVYEAFILAVVISGIFQIIFGFLKAGVIGDYVPNSVIKGMLAAIGLILILKQFPHLIGYDADFAGDESFSQPDKENTFTEIISAVRQTTTAAIIIGFVSILTLMLWEQKFFKTRKVFQWIPGPLVAVVCGILINWYFTNYNPGLALAQKQLVQLPIAENAASLISFLKFPDFGYLNNPDVWQLAGTLAIVASLETLLSIEAVDKLDPLKRVTPTNRELKAQGIGNVISGLLGGLPIYGRNC
jgi:MFS superfamily sulfate permease-like transporter